VTAVLSWFATHYGPSGSDQGGGSAYNSASADPLIAGLTGNGSPTDITTAIQVDIVKAEGGTPNRSPANQTFADQLLSFARTYQAPWSLKVALNSNGPYLAGTSYGGTLAINDKFGQRVPVRGINISATGQTNVAIDMAQGETTGDGSVTFTYTPSSDGPFDAQFVTSDVAGRAPIYEDASAPGGYQRLMTPERADSSADLRGSVIPPNAVSGGLIVGKVNETGLVALGGAVFNIFDITGQYRETVVTSDGSGTPGNELPTGIGVSSSTSNKASTTSWRSRRRRVTSHHHRSIPPTRARLMNSIQPTRSACDSFSRCSQANTPTPCSLTFPCRAGSTSARWTPRRRC